MFFFVEDGFLKTPPVSDGALNGITRRAIIELAEKVIEMTQSTSSLVYDPLPENDPVRRQPDITLASKMLGWKPTVELDEGLVHTINYFSQNRSLLILDKKLERSQKYFKKLISESV